MSVAATSTGTAASVRKPGGLAFLSVGFRPFFLAAGAWAAIALALWICMLKGQLGLPTRFDPMAWHIHEMLFGFAMATMGGFLLRAVHGHLRTDARDRRHPAREGIEPVAAERERPLRSRSAA